MTRTRQRKNPNRSKVRGYMPPPRVPQHQLAQGSRCSCGRHSRCSTSTGQGSSSRCQSRRSQGRSHTQLLETWGRMMCGNPRHCNPSNNGTSRPLGIHRGCCIEIHPAPHYTAGSSNRCRQNHMTRATWSHLTKRSHGKLEVVLPLDSFSKPTDC